MSNHSGFPGPDTVRPPTANQVPVITKKVGHSNDVVLDFVKRSAEEHRYTGKIIIHCLDGVMRKTEFGGAVDTEDLLTRARVGQ